MGTRDIFLWGALPSLPPDEDFNTTYKRSGYNLGNTLIGNGVTSVLEGYDFLYRSQFSSPQDVDEKCGHIVIPASNFLWKNFDLGFMADFIEPTNLPVTMIGLGAQTNDRSLVTEIHPNTLRLVKIISERSPSIGVRGFYTAEVLAAHGILNVEVLGCPSLYAKCSPPRYIGENKNLNLNRFAVNFSRRVQSHSFNRNILQLIENSLLKLAIKHNCTFIAQDELEEVAMANSSASEIEISNVTSYFNDFNRIEVVDYFSKNSIYFCDFQSWSNFMISRSGCIGSRLHGNIAALTNGIPCLMIAHDSRTLEMCSLIGAPHINIKNIDSNRVSSEFLLDAFQSADYSLYFSNMKHLFRKYKKFLDQHGLINRL
jgi:hypothetical protein